MPTSTAPNALGENCAEPSARSALRPRAEFRRAPALGRPVLPVLLLLAGIMPSCQDTGEPVHASIRAGLLSPKALLDRARRLEIRVLEAATCDEATGVTGGDAAREVVRRELGSVGCAEGARFCGDVNVDKSDAIRVFEAKAVTDTGGVVAVGCTSIAVDRDSVSLTIKMYRYVAPANCGDGVIQPTEQCEGESMALCDRQCQSNELLLSVGDAGNHTDGGDVGDKTDPVFLWPAQSGNAGRLLAFYTDRAVSSGTNNVEVGVRVMGDRLGAVTTPPALANGSIFLPNGGAFPPEAAPRQQSLPQAAFLQGKYYVVFQDDDSPGNAGLDIHLRAIDDAFLSEQGTTPLYVNGSQTTGEAAIQTAPAIAAGDGRLFVAWEDAGQQKIAGRTLTPPSTFGNQNDISTGTGNSRPRVAKVGAGWVTVWRSGTGIKLRAINTDGTPQGAEQTVNEGSEPADVPSVASLDDGRFAITWSAGGDVFVQRYDARGVKVAGDQTLPVNDVFRDGEQTAPSIAATPAAGGSYVLVWLDAATNHVRGRFLGGSSGFLFNNVNGQATEFQASRTQNHERANPTVSVGGAGPFVAIGWEDKSTSTPGIFARRFPLPSE